MRVINSRQRVNRNVFRLKKRQWSRLARVDSPPGNEYDINVLNLFIPEPGPKGWPGDFKNETCMKENLHYVRSKGITLCGTCICLYK